MWNFPYYFLWFNAGSTIIFKFYLTSYYIRPSSSSNSWLIFVHYRINLVCMDLEADRAILEPIEPTLFSVLQFEIWRPCMPSKKIIISSGKIEGTEPPHGDGSISIFIREIKKYLKAGSQLNCCIIFTTKKRHKKWNVKSWWI